MKNSLSTFRLFSILTLLSLLLANATPAFAERVYDSNGNLIRSSTWLQPVAKPKEEENANVQSEPALQGQLSMSEMQTSCEKAFTSKEIEQTHSKSLSEFLKSQGFHVLSSGGEGTKTELSYKGFSGFCIKVYIDGIYANNPATGEFDWNSIDLNSIESIVIAELPTLGVTEFSGCSVFITTKKGGKGFLAAETAVGSYETNFFDGLYQSLSYGASSKDFFYRIGSSVVLNDNEYARDISTRVNMFNFSKTGNFSFNWNAKCSKNISLYGTHYLSYNNLKAYGTGTTLSTGIEEDLNTQHNFSIIFDYDKVKADTNFCYFYGQSDYLDKYTYNNVQKTLTNTQSVSFRQNIHTVFDISLGYKEEHMFSTTADRHQLDLGISKEHKWDWFSLTPCMKVLVYYSDADWKAEPLPRLTLGFKDCVFLSGYRIFTLPTFNQLFWPDCGWATGNPDLIPESGWASSVSFKKEDFPLYFRFTYSYYENKIRWNYINWRLTPENTKNADYYVANIGYKDSYWNNRILLQADFTVTQARLRETYRQIMWVPEYQAHASFGFNYKGFELLADYTYTAKRYSNNDNTLYYPGFHMLDACISYQVNPEFQLYFKGTNLLDEHAIYHDGYFVPSRKWTIGAKFKK